MIGQEELPLRGASAIGPKATAVRLPAGVDKPSVPFQPGVRANPDCLCEGGNPDTAADAQSTLHAAPCSAPVKPQSAAGAADAHSSLHAAPYSVPVEIRAVPSRGGRPKSVERYPFATLLAIEIDARGDMSGPSFLIPEADNPDNRLAAARKRYPDKRFISRRVPGGTLVWREA